PWGPVGVAVVDGLEAASAVVVDLRLAGAGEPGIAAGEAVVFEDGASGSEHGAEHAGVTAGCSGVPEGLPVGLHAADDRFTATIEGVAHRSGRRSGLRGSGCGLEGDEAAHLLLHRDRP